MDHSLNFLSNLIQKKIKTAIGMTRCRYALTGAAPINQEILILFQSLNIPLFEGYGMTEDSAGASINYFEKNKIGTVGPALPGTEIKILSDGEIVIKGPHVMKGYYNNPEATKEVLKDGWLHTGDVGKIDEDGFLTIIGRKKEIYVTSGGKNIAPLNFKDSMKSIPLVSQCFLIGDRRYSLGINNEKQYRNIKSLNTRHTLCKTSYWEIISWRFC